MSIHEPNRIQRLPEIDPEDFRERLYNRYSGGGSLVETLGLLVDDIWPVGLVDGEPVLRDGRNVEPSYREHQRNAVIEMLNTLYIEDKDVCQLSAPTGAGKSLILYALARAVHTVVSGKTFTTTPLNTLIDQMNSDEFLDDIMTIKGRSNYKCVHPDDRGTSVDNAICQRQDNFHCEYKEMPHNSGGCPYYARKRAADSKANVVTNLSFLMANSMIPEEVDAGLSARQQLSIDECQRIEDFALTFIGFVVSKRSVPIDWDKISSMPSEDDSMDETVEWLRNEVLRLALERREELEGKNLLSEREQDAKEDLTRWIQKVQTFLSDVREHHWTKTHDRYNGTEKIEFKPIFIGRFLDNFLWDQANKVILSSATIPKGTFIEEIGLDDKQVGRVEVPSTFPPERRPVVTDRAVGKMTWSERDKTLPKMADEISRLADEWDGHKGFVHCHSYSIAERLYDRLPHDVKQRTRLQDNKDREGSLEDWMDAQVSETGKHSDEGGQVFLSVAQEEGISLDDGLCRWQVVAKIAYPHMQDERVSYRMDNDTMDGADWTWYSSSAAIALQQAVGRGMRSKDDWCITYVLDSSGKQLIERNEYLFENWFMDAVGLDEFRSGGGETEEKDEIDQALDNLKQMK